MDTLPACVPLVSFLCVYDSRFLPSSPLCVSPLSFLWVYLASLCTIPLISLSPIRVYLPSEYTFLPCILSLFLFSI